MEIAIVGSAPAKWAWIMEDGTVIAEGEAPDRASAQIEAENARKHIVNRVIQAGIREVAHVPAR